LMGGMGGVLIFVLILMEKTISVVSDKSWKNAVQRFTLFTLHWRVLAVLYIVAGYLVASFSSVIVASDGAALSQDITIKTIDGSGEALSWLCKSDEIQRRFCVGAGLFGSTYQLSVAGYLPRSIEVYPLVGARVRPEEDLRRSPTVLIRPSRKALNTLGQCDESDETNGEKRCGYFELCHLKSEEKCKILVSRPGHVGSFLVGWAQSLPSGLLLDWQLELTVQKADADAASYADTLLKWRNYELFSPGALAGINKVAPLEPGMLLRARVYSKADKVAACKLFQVGEVSFLDVAMVSALKPTPEAQKCAG